MEERRILMLQGPHGPFFGQLADALRAAGHSVWRVGFNRGDQVFWRGRPGYVPFRGAPTDWPSVCSDLLVTMRITDIVLYGDTRPIHAQAVQVARARGVAVHVFEEGYLRPYWITYERGGSNGHSRLMDMSVADMRRALARSRIDPPEVPARWGELREHMFYGALYHFCVMAANGAYPGFHPHRGITVAGEFRLHLRRLLLLPWHAGERWLATRRVRKGGFPYHLVLMQLEHDASFQAHSTYASMTEFIAECLDGFARGAPRHHHLVFKAHPLEDGRAPLRQTIRTLARSLGIAERVHFLRGGKLAALLGAARSVVTVNSTAAQQALWRGLPLLALGRAVYSKPELASAMPVQDFFATPVRPDMTAYCDYRQYLVETSQVPGGFYSARGRRMALRQIVDMMLAPHDPYDALVAGTATSRQELRSSA